MVDYRSSSFEYGDDSRRRIKTYYEPIPASSNYNHHHDFRSFSASFAAPPPPPPPTQMGGGVKDFKTKKGKKSKSVCWGFSDPEFERKKRVAGYKLYSVEGKLKAPFRKSVRWLKGKYSEVTYGWY